MIKYLFTFQHVCYLLDESWNFASHYSDRRMKADKISFEWKHFSDVFAVKMEMNKTSIDNFLCQTFHI